MTSVKENSIDNVFLNFWHKEKRAVAIDIMDVYNREVRDLKIFCDCCHAGGGTKRD